MRYIIPGERDNPCVKLLPANVSLHYCSILIVLGIFYRRLITMHTKLDREM